MMFSKWICDVCGKKAKTIWTVGGVKYCPSCYDESRKCSRCGRIKSISTVNKLTGLRECYPSGSCNPLLKKIDLERALKRNKKNKLK